MGLSGFLLNLPSIFQNLVVSIRYNMIELDNIYPVDLVLPDRIIIVSYSYCMVTVTN